jgi:hypothetical protein
MRQLNKANIGLTLLRTWEEVENWQREAEPCKSDKKTQFKLKMGTKKHGVLRLTMAGVSASSFRVSAWQDHGAQRCGVQEYPG